MPKHAQSLGFNPSKEKKKKLISLDPERDSEFLKEAVPKCQLKVLPDWQILSNSLSTVCGKKGNRETQI
jgi:hypothetical protein